MIEFARHHAAQNEMATAAVYYEAAFNASLHLRSAVQRLACGEACAWKAESAALQGSLGTAADWYFRGLVADPLADELKALYLAAAERAKKQIDDNVAKIEGKQ